MKTLNDMFKGRTLAAEKPLTALAKLELFAGGFLYGIIVFMLLEGVTR